MNRQKTISIVLVILVYIVSTGISYALSSKVSRRQNSTSTLQPASSQTGGKLGFDEGLPKTEPCPLNGEMYSKKQKEWWGKHRPLGVMIENHIDSRPQSGLSSADVVYEAVAEGGITRFLAIFYCKDASTIGPVRSARTYFLDWVSEYGDYPLYAHVGGANKEGPADALGQIQDYGWGLYNDLSQFSEDLSYPTFKRVERPNSRDVAAEHTMFSSTEGLWKVAVKRKLTDVNEDSKRWDEKFVKYSFKDDAKVEDRPQAEKIHLELWEDYKEYAIDWAYDKVSNIYKRNNGGKPHLDRNTNKQLTAKNIVVLVMVESHAFDGYDNNVHLLYRTKGTGKAYIFMDGKQVVGRWEKDSRTARTEIYDNLGKPVTFNAGTIWFEMLPTNGVINVS